jgi:hypothetical protein
MASTMNGLLPIPRRRRLQRIPLANAFRRRSIEALVLRAYLQLVRVPWNEVGSRRTSLAKYGNYEVLLLERMSADADHFPHLWVELYAHDLQISIDGCGCDDIEAAAIAAEHIMSQARQLGESKKTDRAGSLRTLCG